MQTNLPPIPSKLFYAGEKQRMRARIMLMIISVLLLALIIIGVVCPTHLSYWVGQISPGCVFRRYTGIACPGCGGTRSLRALLAGDFINAFRYNMLMPITILALLTEYVRQCIVNFTRRADWRNNRVYVRAFVIYAWSVFAWFILRNLFGI